MARPNPNAPLGEGGRFAAVEAEAAASGASNPAAVAAAVGRKKYGAKKMGELSAKGRKASKRKKKGPPTTTAYQGEDNYKSY